MKKLTILFFLLRINAEAQSQNDPLIKDVQCFDRSAYSALDMMMSARENGAYQTIAEWSQKVSSNQIIRKDYPLEGGTQYVFLLSTEESADGSAIEIRDHRGAKIDYVYSTNDLDKNQITYYFTPPDDDTYRIQFRVVNNHKPLSCMYMAILKGDPDPDAQ